LKGCGHPSFPTGGSAIECYLFSTFRSSPQGAAGGDRLEDGAYARPIAQELEERAHRSLALGTIYVALPRLEDKGMVDSRLADSTPVQGGRAKRYYRVTEDGLEALREAQATLERLWEGLELRPDSGISR